MLFSGTKIVVGVFPQQMGQASKGLIFFGSVTRILYTDRKTLEKHIILLVSPTTEG